MLAGDPIEAAEQARAFLKDASLEDYYDEIMLKGLRLAAADRRLGHLDEDRLDRILGTVTDLTGDLEFHDDIVRTDGSEEEKDTGFGALVSSENAEEDVRSLPEEWKSPKAIICIPGSNKLDEAAAIVLAQMFQRRGFGGVAEKADALSMSKLFSLDLSKAKLICICYVESPSDAMMHYAVRRISKKGGSSTVILALLGDDGVGQADRVDDASVVFESFKLVIEAVANIARSDSPTQSKVSGPPLLGSKAS
jgi:hypothetical protein